MHPRAQELQGRGPNTFCRQVGHPFTFLKGTVTLNFEVLSMENHLTRVRINGKSIGSAFEILTEIRLEEHVDQTKLMWSADMKSSGLLAAMPDTVSKGAAISLADRIFACLEQRSTSGKCN